MISSELKHDLNNMLNLIIGNLELLRERSDLDKDDVENILEDAFSAAREAEQMLASTESQKTAV